MSNSFSQIEKLNSENYASWSAQMRSLLITQDLWDVVERSCPPSASPEEKHMWERTNKKALATMILCVKSSE